MSAPLDERAGEMRDLFFETAQELLQVLNEEGLALEKCPGDEEAIRKVRRAVHTLKGDAAAMGFRELTELAHEFEDVLTPELAARRGAGIAEVVLAAADAFQSMLSSYRKSARPSSAATLRKQLRTMAGAEGAARGAMPRETGHMLEPRFHWSEYERLLMAEAIAKGEDVYNVGIALDTANSMPSAAWQLVRNVLHSCGTVLALRPEDDEDIEKRKAVEAALSSTHTKEALAKRLRIPSVTQQVTVEPAVTPGDVLLDFGALLPQDFAAEPAPVAAQGAAGRTANVSEPHAQFGIEAAAQGEPAAPARPESPAMAAPASKSPQSSAAPRVPASALVEKTLRVDSERIDDVLNLVGELIIGKSMLARTIAEFDRRFQRDALGAKFADALGFQSRILDNLQKSVMKIRMVPVEQLFRRFPRVVRDIAKLRGKDVALSISGQDTDLDKSILEPLAEPITHLIRNCVDHGIEPPEERIAAGKSARGTIHLDAYHQGNQVVIEVGDDGRGIDRKKVVERAIELGFVSREDAAHLTDMEALGLIFVHGFTMARQVTEISGRGVGMDVVQTVLEHLKGTVTVQSALGAGTTFFLRLPLTLASMKALLAEVCGRLYAIPLASVVEITRTTEEEIHVADGQEVFRLRDQVLKLVRLERLAEAPRASASRRLFVIVVALGDRKFGLVVDNLKGEEDLVIKALDNRLAQSEFVNGASILGDGTVVLILNLPIVVSKLSRAAVAEVMA